MTIRVGVLGAGRIGRIHCASLKALAHLADLKAVCDPMLDMEWACSLQIPHALSNEDELFALDLDAVIIASPTTAHYKHIVRSIERGFHMLCEKPVDLKLAPHFAIRDQLKNSACKLQIGFNRRFDGDFNKMAELAKRGELGTPYLVRITSRDPGLPSFDYLKTSGGMFVDMTIHDFDMARFLMGSDVAEVFAYGDRLVDKRLVEINDIDTAVITLKFANGAFGVIDNSRQAVYGYDQRAEIFGSGGSITNDHHRATSVEMHSASGSQKEPILHFFLERYLLSYRREMEAFLSAITDNKSVTPSIDDAIAAVRLAHAAQESLLARKPITVASA